MLSIAYETLAPRGELVALEVKDIDFHPDGTGQALIRRGKTDAEGQEGVAYLSREDGEVAKDMAGACPHSTKGRYFHVGSAAPDRWAFKSGRHRADFRAGGAVDWACGAVC